MWLIRRMLKISYMRHETNQEVLYIAQQKRTLSITIKGRKCKYFGHIVRKVSMQRHLLEAKINGKRLRGIPTRNRMDGIMQWLHLNYQDCVGAVGCRSTFRTLDSSIGENSCDYQVSK